MEVIQISKLQQKQEKINKKGKKISKWNSREPCIIDGDYGEDDIIIPWDFEGVN